MIGPGTQQNEHMALMIPHYQFCEDRGVNMYFLSFMLLVKDVSELNRVLNSRLIIHWSIHNSEHYDPFADDAPDLICEIRQCWKNNTIVTQYSNKSTTAWSIGVQDGQDLFNTMWFLIGCRSQFWTWSQGLKKISSWTTIKNDHRASQPSIQQQVSKNNRLHCKATVAIHLITCSPGWNLALHGTC